jgi:hypothetical protein
LAEGYLVPWSWLFFLLAAVGLLDRSASGFLRSLSIELGWRPWMAPFLWALLLWLGGGAVILLVRKGLEIRLRWKNPEAAVAVPSLNPFLRRQRRLFEELLDALQAAAEKLAVSRQQGQAPQDSLLDEVDRLQEVQAKRFPHHSDYILASVFGNIVRAVESYPLRMYGFEATQGWTRLLAVVPAEYRELIDTVKAEMDFLVNVWFVSWAFLFGYFLLFEITGQPVALWAAVLAYTSVRLASGFSWDAAARWGETLKSAADVFLPDLWRRLQLEPASSRQEEMKTWNRIGAAWAFNDPNRLPPKACPREAPQSRAGKGREGAGEE